MITLEPQPPFYDMSFPAAGMDLHGPFGKQMPLQLPDQSYGRTSREGINVLSFEQEAGRMRGGSRPGLRKYINSSPVPGWLIQALNSITWTGGTPVQLSQSGRVVQVVVVSQGNVYFANAGDTSWTPATNTTPVTPPLNFTGIIYSTALNQKLWFADGINWCYYDPTLAQVIRWTATAGTLPADSVGNTPRLIAAWRGRIVVAGVLFQPQNWFMSRVGDPTDWDTNPGSPSPDQAITGTDSPLGIIGDVITGLIPFSDDLLIFLGDSSIWQLSGDPMNGGKIMLVSDAIGGAWGKAWCKDPYGNIYFVSNKMGIYMIPPGGPPQRVSQPIEQLVSAVDTGANAISCQWNDKLQGMHVFVSPLASPSSTTHFFWEYRTNAWWEWQHANTNHDPLVCCTFDGNLPGDRVAIFGSWDGYVRFYDPNATDDDGTNISSSIVVGPIASKNLEDFILDELQAVLGVQSGQVTFQVYSGATAEGALSNPAVFSGTWRAGRNFTNLVRRAGHAIYVKITSTVAWQIESIRATLERKGIIPRGRGA